jgi:translation initiation factor 1A
MVVKKNVKGGKAHKKKKKDSKTAEDFKSTKHVDKKLEDQEYGQVTKLLGNCRLEVLCFDGVNRLCHIRGSMRKKVWIKVNDIVLISLREFEQAKADIIYKYEIPEINYLKKENEIPDNIKLYEDVEEIKDDGFDFTNESDEEEEKKEIDIDNI